MTGRAARGIVDHTDATAHERQRRGAPSCHATRSPPSRRCSSQRLDGPRGAAAIGQRHGVELAELPAVVREGREPVQADTPDELLGVSLLPAEAATGEPAYGRHLA